MRSILSAAVGIAALSALAHAEYKDGSKIAEAAQKCWNMPYEENAVGSSATLDAKIDDAGGGIFRIHSFTPDTGIGRSVAQSAKRALQKCAPFQDIEPGFYRLKMTYQDPFEGAE